MIVHEAEQVVEEEEQINEKLKEMKYAIKMIQENQYQQQSNIDSQLKRMF